MNNRLLASTLLAIPALAFPQSGLSPDHVFEMLVNQWTPYAGYCIAVDAQNRPVCFGEIQEQIPIYRRLFYTRCLPSAVADPTFDDDGLVEHNICTHTEKAIDLACAPDGKIIGMGQEDYPDYDLDGIYVHRLFPDGSPDTTFWDNGKFIFQWNGEYTQARAMALQPDGGIVVAGLNNDYDSFLIRLDPNGQFDTDFGTGGGAAIGIGDQLFDDPADVVAMPDGSLIVCGWWRPEPNAPNGLYVTRVLPDGTVDPDYGDGGSTLLNDPVLNWIPGYIDNASDGSVYVASYLFSTSPDIDQLIVQHFLVDGSYDQSFGDNGIRVIPMPGNYTNQQPVALVVLPNDLVAVCPKIDQAGLALLLPNGQFAMGFGTNGILLDPDHIVDQLDNRDMAADLDGNLWILTGNADDLVAYKVIMDLSVGTIDAGTADASPMLLGTIVTGTSVELTWRMEATTRMNIDLLATDAHMIGPLWGGEAATGDNRRTLQLPAGLAPGTYLLRFATGKTASTVRFIKH